MKRVLIISPHFPPVNAADMQRVRQCLPFLKEFGWEAEVMAVDPAQVEAYSMDPLLLQTIPVTTQVHNVKAWKASRTRKFGLGSLSMRSFFYFKRKGNELLRKKQFDLIFFSTTAFHVLALGPYWKKKFGLPFIIDIQDPWRNDFYLTKPQHERPPKFWIAYTIDKWLERYTVPKVDGVVSVSQGYVDTLRNRYKRLAAHRFTVIPFAGSKDDFQLLEKHIVIPSIQLTKDKINVVYVGRGGHDLQLAVEILFLAFKKGLSQNPHLFSSVHFWFVGTSYAPKDEGKKTIEPMAQRLQVDAFVTEVTDRIPYFETLALLKQADILFVPGSTDKAYTASKIYPYILAAKPLFAIFYRESSVVSLLEQTEAGEVICFRENDSPQAHVDECLTVFTSKLLSKKATTNFSALEPYLAKAMTKKQTDFFNQVIQFS